MKIFTKLFTFALAILFVGFFTFFSQLSNVGAQKSDFLTQISQYKSWTKLTKEPIKLEISGLSAGG